MQRFEATSAKRRSSVAADAPIVRIQRAALSHPDPFVRCGCLCFLDHYANEASASVFALALRDPVELVRHIALHSLACESCRTEEVCVADAVPLVVGVLSADPSPELRHKAIPVLLRLADRDPQSRQAVERAADSDGDALVRDVARRALASQHVRSRKARTSAEQGASAHHPDSATPATCPRSPALGRVLPPVRDTRRALAKSYSSALERRVGRTYRKPTVRGDSAWRPVPTVGGAVPRCGRCRANRRVRGRKPRRSRPVPRRR
jgi:HEAT repeats